MPSTYTLNNGIELIGTGEQSGTWGDTTNTNLSLLDTALDGQVTVTLPSAGTSGSPNPLAITDGEASDGRNRMVTFADGGDLGATAFVQLTPNDSEKIIYVRNNLAGSRSIILFQGTYNASNDYEVPAGTTAVVYFDGAGSGAVAANVFNNAYFDSLRLGGVSVTAIIDDDTMGTATATNIATSESIKAYVDAQVGANNELSEVLANGNTTGGNDILFGDDDKAIFGAGSDLQLYHDGTHSYVGDVGQGNLRILAGNFELRNTGNTERMILAEVDAGVSLYYDNAEKIITTTSGVDITGTAVTDGLTVAGNLSVDGGTIKLDGNYPTGSNNVALGNNALDAIITGGNFNTAVGTSALTANTSGYENTAIGYNAMLSNETGLNNTAVGSTALDANTTGGSNVAVGGGALGSNTTAYYNTAVGHTALFSNETGYYNSALGWRALYTNSNASYNTAVGYSALYDNTTGANNTAFGAEALENNTTASNSTAVGYQAGNANTTGSGIVAVGRTALLSNTTGSANTGVGTNALQSTTSGNYNTALGQGSLELNTTASSNTAVGYQALYSQTTASTGQNLGMGYQAGYTTNGFYNTFLGYISGKLSTGNQNTFLGHGAGNAMTSGSKNTILGMYTGNQGGLDIRTSSNNIVLSDGDGNPRLYYNNGSLTWFSPAIRDKTTAAAANMHIDATGGYMMRSTSSLRYKNTVNDATHGLTELLALRPVTYKGNNDGDTVFGGLIAEEVHDAGLTEFVQYNDDGEPDALAYSNMVSLCIKAIQEQQATITALEARITALENA